MFTYKNFYRIVLCMPSALSDSKENAIQILYIFVQKSTFLHKLAETSFSSRLLHWTISLKTIKCPQNYQ